MLSCRTAAATRCVEVRVEHGARAWSRSQDAFDVLLRDGEDVRGLPLLERKMLLRCIISQRYHACSTSTTRVHSQWSHVHLRVSEKRTSYAGS